MPKNKRDAIETSADCDRQEKKWTKKRNELSGRLAERRAGIESIEAERSQLLVAAVGAEDAGAQEALRVLTERLDPITREARDLEQVIAQIDDDLRRLVERRADLLRAETVEELRPLDVECDELAEKISAALDGIKADVEHYMRNRIQQCERAAKVGLNKEYLGGGFILAIPQILAWNATRGLDRRWHHNVHRAYQSSFADFHKAWSSTPRAADPAPVRPESNQLLDYTPNDDADDEFSKPIEIVDPIAESA